MISLCFVLGLSGCISIPNSPTSRFYVLSSIDQDQVSQKFNIPSDVIIGIGPVKIPEYQNRPQMVTQSQEKMLKFAQFDRWGESLNIGVSRLIREDLTVMLPRAKFTLYPWNPSTAVKYRVTVEVVKLDSDLGGNMIFVAQWLVLDMQNIKTLVIKRSEFRQAIIPQNYSGLTKTLSLACASVSGDIAQALSTLETARLKTK